ncbi:MAG: septum formation initiator family protein [Bacteroidales bacterium]|nr:septum formation initiator family protein [Bacteroidales bacterium]
MKKIFKILKNKYLLVSLAFAVWIIFFDQNNLIYQRSLRKELKKVEAEHSFYKKEINKDSRKYLEIITDNDRLEKFAREKYLMKRENEDVFLIVNEE